MADFNTGSIGEALCAERMRRGLNLGKISTETKISKVILEAIENDQFARIPGGVYTRSFLRQYAQVVGLDEEEILKSFRQQYEVQAEPLAETPQKPESRHAPCLWALVVVAALAGVYEVSDSDRDGGDADRAVVTGMNSEDLPARPQTAEITNPSRPITSAVHVEFSALEPVWVSVECDGVLSYTGTLVGPESKAFEASRVVTVLVGNAGGLVIILNGRQIGPLGAHGEIQLLELGPTCSRRLPRRPSQPTPLIASPQAF